MAVRNGHARAYTPAKTVNYESLIALAGQQAMDNRAPLETPIGLVVSAIFAIPKSWPKKRRQKALGSIEWHTSRPDGDNILKAVGDGLNGVVWHDDSQIATCRIQKFYGETPCLEIDVEVLA